MKAVCYSLLVGALLALIVFNIGQVVSVWYPTRSAVAMPQHVMCGHLDYTIMYQPMDSAFGMTISERQMIYIEPGYSLAFEQQVLLHELMHCAHEATARTVELHQGFTNINKVGMSADEWIEATAPGIEQLLRDNPELVRYLSQR